MLNPSRESESERTTRSWVIGVEKPTSEGWLCGSCKMPVRQFKSSFSVWTVKRILLISPPCNLLSWKLRATLNIYLCMNWCQVLAPPAACRNSDNKIKRVKRQQLNLRRSLVEKGYFRYKQPQTLGRTDAFHHLNWIPFVYWTCPSLSRCSLSCKWLCELPALQLFPPGCR